MNTDTPTPRTDAFHRNMTDEEEAVSWMSFARQLERELAAVTKERDEADQILTKLQFFHGCSREMVFHWCEWEHKQIFGLQADLAAARAELAAINRK